MSNKNIDTSILGYMLEKMNSINDKYDEIDKINGVNFNIFSILNMERKEVKTHSNFIYELLNPNGLHSKGDMFLKLFFKNVLGDLNFDTLSVISQVIQEDTTEENRRIDFTIETDEYCIGIEMKIDAIDQDSQLYDYYSELKNRVKKKRKTVKLFYLTLNGKNPSEESISKAGNKHKDAKYQNISFENDIINWIEECIKESATDTTIREALIQYLNLLNKITNKSNSKGRKMEMKKLLSNGKNLEAYLKAENDVIEIKIELQCIFWHKLINKLNDVDLSFEFYDEYKSKNIEEAVEKYYKGKMKNREYEYVLYLDDKKDLYFTLTLEDCMYYEVGSCNGDNKNMKEIKKLSNLEIKEIDSCYTVKKINFYDLLDTPEIFDYFDDKVLNQVVDNLVNEIKDIKMNIDKILKQT